MKRRAVSIVLVVVAALGALAIGVRSATRHEAAPDVATATVSRGSIVSAIAATGTLQAVTTVEVGTQVSGTVQALAADFNEVVKRGQVIARLEPSLFETALEQARANLVRAEADAERLEVGLVQADRELQRARELASRQLIAMADLDAADVSRRTIEAQIRSAEAQVTQARVAVTTAQVNLAKTVITSPIDGFVIARNVDVGQTVAASLQAPTLFVIAADLSQMEVNAAVDESDLGRIAAGQQVWFTVDAYPGDTFTGTVKQVRLNPTVTSNVVTYAAMISAPNPGLKLKPGMTANLTIEVARADAVLWVPNAALRLRPTAAALEAIGSPLQAPGVATAPGKGVLWVRNGALVEPVVVTLGISDGTRTAILEPPFGEGTEVLTKLAFASATTTSTATGATPSSSPLMPTPPRGGPMGPPPGR